ncbi:Cell cycle serine/threonine-protein kinase CDC5/MSD2 [Verticillium dahliae VDG1]|nr:Cell cycle serine/threonine-protein kinase CDC5/MSD2 [Verticillium dahliae VDG1]
MVADVEVGGPLGHGSLGALGPWPLLANVRDARSLDFQMEPPSPPIPQLCHDAMCTIHRHNQAATLANGGLSSFSSASGGGRASSQPSPLPSPPSSQISLDDDPLKLDDDPLLPTTAFSFQPSLPPAQFDFLPPAVRLRLRGEVVSERSNDEEMAFPEDMGRYGSADDDDDDDAGDVYSDFGAIFGGPREGDFSDDDEHSYEECLDELDGISWVGR